MAASSSVATRTIAGIVEDPSAAERTLARLEAHSRTRPSFLLFAHDAAGLARFAAGQFTVF